MKALIRILPVLLCGCAALAQAQQATERFIPLGMSPGVSGRYTMIGAVNTFEGGVLTLSVPGNAAAQQVRVSAATRIWLDRSAAQQASLAGTPAELRAGRRVEVKLAAAATPATAQWIKVDAAAVP